VFGRSEGHPGIDLEGNLAGGRLILRPGRDHGQALSDPPGPKPLAPKNLPILMGLPAPGDFDALVWEQGVQLGTDLGQKDLQVCRWRQIGYMGSTYLLDPTGSESQEEFGHHARFISTAHGDLKPSFGSHG